MRRQNVIDVDGEWLGEGEDQIEPVPDSRPRTIPLAPDRDAIMWGIAGVAVGSLVTGVITALAFNSFNKTKSPWGPALISGLGSAVVGGGLLLLASRANDSRVLHAAGGFRLAR